MSITASEIKTKLNSVATSVQQLMAQHSNAAQTQAQAKASMGALLTQYAALDVLPDMLAASPDDEALKAWNSEWTRIKAEIAGWIANN